MKKKLTYKVKAKEGVHVDEDEKKSSQSTNFKPIYKREGNTRSLPAVRRAAPHSILDPKLGEIPTSDTFITPSLTARGSVKTSDALAYIPSIDTRKPVSSNLSVFPGRDVSDNEMPLSDVVLKSSSDLKLNILRRNAARSLPEVREHVPYVEKPKEIGSANVVKSKSPDHVVAPLKKETPKRQISFPDDVSEIIGRKVSQGKQPGKYWVFSKYVNRAYLFDQNNEFIATTVMGRGRDVGDFVNTTTDEGEGLRSTPAGEGVISSIETDETPSEYNTPFYRIRYNDDRFRRTPTAGIGIHGPWKPEYQERVKKLDDPSIQDKCFSWGCINLHDEFLFNNPPALGDSVFITPEPAFNLSQQKIIQGNEPSLQEGGVIEGDDKKKKRVKATFKNRNVPKGFDEWADKTSVDVYPQQQSVHEVPNRSALDRYDWDMYDELVKSDSSYLPVDGHYRSVNNKTGEWIKYKDHPTAYKELLEWHLNPSVNRDHGHPVEYKPNRLRYPLKKMRAGGVIDNPPGGGFQTPEELHWLSVYGSPENKGEDAKMWYEVKKILRNRPMTTVQSEASPYNIQRLKDINAPLKKRTPYIEYNQFMAPETIQKKLGKWFNKKGFGVMGRSASKFLNVLVPGPADMPISPVFGEYMFGDPKSKLKSVEFKKGGVVEDPPVYYAPPASLADRTAYFTPERYVDMSEREALLSGKENASKQQAPAEVYPTPKRQPYQERENRESYVLRKADPGYDPYKRQVSTEAVMNTVGAMTLPFDVMGVPALAKGLYSLGRRAYNMNKFNRYIKNVKFGPEYSKLKYGMDYDIHDIRLKYHNKNIMSPKELDLLDTYGYGNEISYRGVDPNNFSDEALKTFTKNGDESFSKEGPLSKKQVYEYLYGRDYDKIPYTTNESISHNVSSSSYQQGLESNIIKKSPPPIPMKPYSFGKFERTPATRTADNWLESWVTNRKQQFLNYGGTEQEWERILRSLENPVRGGKVFLENASAQGFYIYPVKKATVNAALPFKQQAAYAVHEGTHKLEYVNPFRPKNMFYKMSNNPRLYNDLVDAVRLAPEESYSEIMRMRFQEGWKPKQIITEKMLDKGLEKMGGAYMIEHKIKDKSKFLKIVNETLSITTPVAAGSLYKFKQHGADKRISQGDSQ